MKHFMSGLFVLVLCSASVLQGQDDPLVIAPGITLPQTGIVFALDVVDEKPVLLFIPPSLITHNSHDGSNLLRRLFFMSPRTSIDLMGVHARVAESSANPAFYVRLYGKNLESLRSIVRLVRLQPQRDRRVVSILYGGALSPKRRRVYEDVSVTRVRLSDPSWVKLTPQTPLTPGEYSIAFMLPDPAQTAHEVYDFRIASPLPPQTKGKGSRINLEF
ncbi:MAG: hypothetical protein FWD64_00520 [Acidobacteriaceae bacterium]|nr:hypothetical protein [Acidobacteriaceae bacterium]